MPTSRSWVLTTGKCRIFRVFMTSIAARTDASSRIVTAGRVIQSFTGTGLGHVASSRLIAFLRSRIVHSPASRSLGRLIFIAVAPGSHDPRMTRDITLRLAPADDAPAGERSLRLGDDGALALGAAVGAEIDHDPVTRATQSVCLRGVRE